MRSIFSSFRFGLQASVLVLAAFCAQTARADVINIGGSLNDPTMTNLVGPNGQDPTFGSGGDPANNTALYEINVNFGGFADFNFGGFADFLTTLRSLAVVPQQNIDPYFSLFRGTGANAVFVGSGSPNFNFDDLRQSFLLAPLLNDNCGATHQSGTDYCFFLDPGVYTIAIGVVGNVSNAEEDCYYGHNCTLANGFSGNGDPTHLFSSHFNLTVTTPDAIPEPETLLLLAIAAAAAALQRRRSKRAS